MSKTPEYIDEIIALGGYNPNQPRDPKGSPTGGQFASSGGGNTSKPDKGDPDSVESIKNDFSKARAKRDSGDVIGYANGMLAVQRRAAQSRSQHAYKIEMDAHAHAVMAQDFYKGSDQRIKSELGRIAKESQFRFSQGNTPSRSVTPVY